MHLIEVKSTHIDALGRQAHPDSLGKRSVLCSPWIGILTTARVFEAS